MPEKFSSKNNGITSPEVPLDSITLDRGLVEEVFPDNDHDDEEILDDIVMMKLMLMRLQKCGNTHVLLMYLITHGTVIQMKQMLMDF